MGRPIEQAAQDLTTHAQDDGTLIADDADVLRIARAIVEHRKGLMDRLAMDNQGSA